MGEHTPREALSPEQLQKALRPLVGKKVETVQVAHDGVVCITASGFGGRVFVKVWAA